MNFDDKVIMLGKEIYKTNPVDVLTFIEDPYFLGDVYDTVFKMWKDMIAIYMTKEAYDL